MAAFEFWYEFGSTYSYPAAMRIDHLAAKAGVEVRWRPFLLGPIFQTLGQAEGLPLRLPPVKFPQTGSRRRESRPWVRERRMEASLQSRWVLGELRRAEGHQQGCDTSSDP